MTNLVKKLITSARNYYVHISGQGFAWYTIATHDLSKWETAVAVAGTGILTSLLKRIGTKVPA